MQTRTLATTLFAAAIVGAGLLGTISVRAAGGDYAGESTDPVTGYRCVTPFCDTIAVPNSDCLCQKVNPNESRREDLSFVCTDVKTGGQCSMPGR